MGETMHSAWTLVRVEIGVAILSLLLLFVPLVFAHRHHRRRRHGWNAFSNEFSASAEGLAEAKMKCRSLREWTFWPLLLLGVGGLWIGIPGMRTLQCVERGNAITFGSQIPKAIEWYRKALQYNPDCALAHHGLGAIFQAQGKQDNAMHEYEAALRSDPDNAIYHRDLATLWMQYGNTEAALIEYYRAAALDPKDPDIHGEFARLLVAKGKLDEAIQHYRIAIQYSHDSALLHFDLANTFLLQDKTEAALEQYSLFINLNPKDAHAYNNYGALLYNTNRFPMAEMAFRKATKLDTQYPEAYYNLGRTAQKLGHTEEAIKAFTAFLPLGAKASVYASAVVEAGKQLHLLKATASTRQP
jgi:tetratricopeptide (TPR) repeat protein